MKEMLKRKDWMQEKVEKERKNRYLEVVRRYRDRKKGKTK